MEICCPFCNQNFEVELPKKERKRTGAVVGIALADMTDEQLKIEIRNARSVLNKAIKRGASEDTISINQARVDAALAERDSRKFVEGTDEEAAAFYEELANEDLDTVETESVYADSLE